MSLNSIAALSACCVLMVLASAAASAAEIKVPDDYNTIQEAIDAANFGDEVVVAASTYYENIDFGGNRFTLRSTDPLDPMVVESTIIDGLGLGSVVIFLGSEDSQTSISGFTIRNGSATNGGGINCQGATPTIQHNIVTANEATSNSGRGGGINDCNGLIQYNSINYNSTAAFDGDGGGLSSCDGTIQGNAIFRNHAGVWGGGLYDCDGTIQNNAIYLNGAWNGGSLHSCSGTIQNNTIWGNYAFSNGGGLCYCDGTIRNNIIWQNSAPDGPQLWDSATPTHSIIQDWSGGGTCNSSEAPGLVDPNRGDFHLRPDSPALDAGMFISGLFEDFDRDPRPLDAIAAPGCGGSDYDIGADELSMVFFDGFESGDTSAWSN